MLDDTASSFLKHQAVRSLIVFQFREILKLETGLHFTCQRKGTYLKQMEYSCLLKKIFEKIKIKIKKIIHLKVAPWLHLEAHSTMDLLHFNCFRVNTSLLSQKLTFPLVKAIKTNLNAVLETTASAKGVVSETALIGLSKYLETLSIDFIEVFISSRFIEHTMINNGLSNSDTHHN